MSANTWNPPEKQRLFQHGFIFNFVFGVPVMSTYRHHVCVYHMWRDEICVCVCVCGGGEQHVRKKYVSMRACVILFRDKEKLFD